MILPLAAQRCQQSSGTSAFDCSPINRVLQAGSCSGCRVRLLAADRHSRPGCPKRMATFAEEAEVEFAPRPGLTLTLDEDEQQVTLAVVKPEDRVRIVAAVSLRFETIE